jgi:hypothetical protein
MSTNLTAVDGFESVAATVAFVDLAGFSAITDVYGDTSAIAVLGRFEELVRQALGNIAARTAAIASPGQLLATRRSPASRQHLELMREIWGRWRSDLLPTKCRSIPSSSRPPSIPLG